MTMPAMKPSKLSYPELYEALRSRVYGQDDALEKLAKHMAIAFAGLQNPERPLGIYLLAGPTGVGKTETARSLACILGGPDALLVIDGSMLSERHESSVLFGAPPGYLKSDEPAMISQARISGICANPRHMGVILFDEVEKAAFEVVQAWLQLIDTGVGYTKNQPNQRLDIRRCFMLMTTNLGSKESAKMLEGRGIGFSGGLHYTAETTLAAIKKHFSPEFLSRVDEIVFFRPLDRDTLRAITHKTLDNVQKRLLAANIATVIHLSDEAEAFLVDQVAPTQGARGIQHALERNVVFKLSQMENLGDKEVINIIVKKGSLVCEA